MRKRLMLSPKQQRSKSDRFLETSASLQTQTNPCAEDVTLQAIDVILSYWVSRPHEAAKNELITRVILGQKEGGGYIPPVNQKIAVTTSFLADHGNILQYAGVTI
jgi:hypothetical protein